MPLPLPLQAHSAARAAALTGTLHHPGRPQTALRRGHPQAGSWVGVALLLLCAASATTHVALRSHRPTQVMIGTLQGVADALQARMAAPTQPAPQTPTPPAAQADLTQQAAALRAAALQAGRAAGHRPWK